MELGSHKIILEYHLGCEIDKLTNYIIVIIVASRHFIYSLDNDARGVYLIHSRCKRECICLVLSAQHEGLNMYNPE